MTRFVLQAALAVTALGITLPASAICKWKDEQGRVQYSDAPPPGVRCEGTVSVPPPTSSGAAAPPRSRTVQEQEMEFRKRRLEREEAEKKQEKEKEVADAKRQNCEYARAQLAGLQSGGRIARSDASGQRSFMSDEEIAAEAVKAQKMVDQYCK